jgi:hypothetical protein
MKLYSIIPLLLIWIAASAQTEFSVTDYGAIADGKTLNKTAFQEAIDACHESGGGTVRVPGGTYYTAGFELKENVSLHLASGALLIASRDIDDYVSYGDKKVFILIDSLQNLSITGKGKIDGSGSSFYDENFNPDDNRPTPFIYFSESRGITIEGIELFHSPGHVIRVQNCDGVVINDVRVINDLRTPNTDAIDIGDSKNVMISNCYLESGDDLICLKSSKDTVENVVVTNCVLLSDDAAIKFGTGSHVATRYCSFSNLVIRNTRYGIAFFMLDGGVFEHNSFSDITIESGGRSKHHYPIYIDVDKRKPDRDYGIIRHNTFDNIQMISDGKVLISGHPESPITDLTLRNCSFVSAGMADFSDAKKPRGNKNYPSLNTSSDLSREDAYFALGYMNQSSFENIQVVAEEGSNLPAFTQKEVDAEFDFSTAKP